MPIRRCKAPTAIGCRPPCASCTNAAGSEHCSRWYRPYERPPPCWPIAPKAKPPHPARPPFGSALARLYKLQLDLQADQQLDEILQLYRADPNIEYAERNYILRIDRTPNDPLFGSQWALKKISALQAWDICTGSPNITIAVIDTGIDYTHRDLQPNLWINQLEQLGDDGIDDDNNGYVDDIFGYNFAYNNPDPFDDHGHGTHCAGVIAAVTDNQLDIAGLCWNARIMAVKFMGSHGEGTTADVISAIYYAVANGADILSNSWGGDQHSQALQEAIDFAHSQGLIIVAAAGNGNSDKPHYPAAYNHVLAVTATDYDDNRWSLANYGPWVDLAAPGVAILSLRAKDTSQGYPRDPYTTSMSGTSMACPFVAGSCALLLSANPLLCSDELYQMLISTVEPIEPGICLSNGRINVLRALQRAVPNRGYLSLDKNIYKAPDRMTILLADADLKDQNSHTLNVITSAGDVEPITLTAPDEPFGVLTGTIQTEPGTILPADGRLQVTHNDVVLVTYFDANDGLGQPHAAVAQATIDTLAPSLYELQTSTFALTAQLTFKTNEPTTAVLRVSLACQDQPIIVEQDLTLSFSHTFKLTSLKPATSYYFTIDLTDQAGNSTVADNNGLCYSFTTTAEFPGYRVPDVYPTIQAAIDDANDGQVILVADGIYSGSGNTDISFKGKAITVKSQGGPENCIIDCERQARAFLFHEAEGPNAVLDGFTIKNGLGGKFGGAIRCVASSPTIINCRFIDNSAVEFGGAIYNAYGSSPTISNCTFEHNRTEADVCIRGNGGAIANIASACPSLIDCTFKENYAHAAGGAVYNEENSNPTISNCTFVGNAVGDPDQDRGLGGAIANWSSSPTISRCTFRNNSSARDAACIYNCYASNPILTNCLLVGNTAKDLAGAIKNHHASTVLINCTIAHNTASTCGGIWLGQESSLQAENCIFWENTDDQGTGCTAQITAQNHPDSLLVNYCCIQNLDPTISGIGNIDADPRFVSPETGDYHLSSRGWRWDTARLRWHYDAVTSPCIDTGNPACPLSAEPISIPDDPNNLWALNIRINMGAFGGTEQASLAPPQWASLADLNNDGIVNALDLAWQLHPDTTAQYPPGDLTRNGRVDLTDLAALAQNWLRHVRPPTIELVEPADGAYFYVSLIEIPVRAVADDPDGFVTKVEFFANGEKIAEDTDPSDGWQVLFTHPTGGAFTLTARATDNGHGTTTSNSVHIRVVQPRW